MSLTEKLITFGSLALLLTMLVFSGGFLYRHFAIWPTDDLMILQKQARFYLAHGVWGRSNQFVAADVAAGDDPLRVLQPDRFLPGYRAFMGFDNALGSYSMRLFDGEGALVHVWPIEYRALLPESGAPVGVNPHGMEMFPDGSIVVNFGTPEGEAMARLDACGDPVWIAEGEYHHSVEIGEDGLLWTWFSPVYSRSQLQSIVALDPGTGEVVREIDMRDVAAASEKNAAMLAIPEGFRFTGAARPPGGIDADIFHPNDVEPLRSTMADAFPQFEPGDLLISLRNIDLVAVLDPDTLDLKWGMHGPWRQQHDPDFLASGLIDVYDNNPRRGRSNIVSVDPRSGEVRTRFSGEETRFYTIPQGKQQRLPNGAYLVAVPDEGRVLEIAEDDTLVMEYDNVAVDGLNGRVLHAMWQPEDFYETPPACAR